MDRDVFDLFEDPPPAVQVTVDDLIELVPPPEPPPDPARLPTIPGRIDPASFSLQQLAKDHTEMALRGIVHLAQFAENEGVKLEALKHLLDRGWGKPTMKAEINSKHVSIHTTLKELASAVQNPPRLGLLEDYGDTVNVPAEEVVDADVHD
jgi:hypothetical protein